MYYADDVKERIFAIALSDDYLKGREFEEFVLELLDIETETRRYSFKTCEVRPYQKRIMYG